MVKQVGKVDFFFKNIQHFQTYFVKACFINDFICVVCFIIFFECLIKF